MFFSGAVCDSLFTYIDFLFCMHNIELMSTCIKSYTLNYYISYVIACAKVLEPLHISSVVVLNGKGIHVGIDGIDSDMNSCLDPICFVELVERLPGPFLPDWLPGFVGLS